jgi:hypothetical protein
MKSLRRLFLCTCLLTDAFIFSMNNNNATTVHIKVQQVNTVVDKCLEINESIVIFGELTRWVRGYKQASGLTGSEIAQRLAEINRQCEGVLKNPRLLPLIMEDNSYIRQLVNALPNKVIEEWENIKGSNIDTFLDAAALFPEIAHKQAVTFSDQVNKHYKEEFGVNAGLKKVIYASDGSTGTLVRSFFNKKNMSMNKIQLKKFANATKNEFLCMSLDGKILAFFDKQKTLYWDMETAQEIDNPGPTAWIGGEIKWCDRYYSSSWEGLFSKDNNYLACVDDNTIFLYARPTLAFRLCQLAAINSEKNYKELNSVLQSKMLTLVNGFLQKNLKQAITDQLEVLSVCRQCGQCIN